MPSLEQHINILNEKIEEFRDDKKKMLSTLSKVQAPSNYFKSRNILPIDIYETYIEPHMDIGELLHNNHMASCKCITYCCKCIIGQGLPIVIKEALSENLDTYLYEVIKGFCLAHNIENENFVDTHYLRDVVRDNVDFYELDYLPNFQKILKLRYQIVFNAWTKELLWKDGIINNHLRRLDTMMNTTKWAIPVSKFPDNSLLEMFDEIPNEWGDENLVKVEAMIIKKVCKTLVKIEPIYGECYNLGCKQLKFNTSLDLNDFLLNADDYKLFKIDREGDKIGQYKLDEDGEIFLE
jgi:hypothetical protein